MCRKPKIGSDSVLRELNRPQIFFSRQTETACSPQFKSTVTKITLLAFDVQIRNVLKHYRNTV